MASAPPSSAPSSTPAASTPAASSAPPAPPPAPVFTPLPLTRLPSGSLSTVPYLTLLTSISNSLLSFLHLFLSDSPLPLPSPPPFPSTTPSATSPLHSPPFSPSPPRPSDLTFLDRRHLLTASLTRYHKALSHLAALAAAFLCGPVDAHKGRRASRLTEALGLADQALRAIHDSWVKSDGVLAEVERHCGDLWGQREPALDVLGALEVLSGGGWNESARWDPAFEEPSMRELDPVQKEEVGQHLTLALAEKILASPCVDRLKALPGVSVSSSSSFVTVRHPSYSCTLAHISPPGSPPAPWKLLDVAFRPSLRSARDPLALTAEDRGSVRVVAQALLDVEDLGGGGVGVGVGGIGGVVGVGGEGGEGPPDPAATPLLALHHHLHLYSQSVHLSLISLRLKELCKHGGLYHNAPVKATLSDDGDRLDVSLWDGDRSSPATMHGVNCASSIPPPQPGFVGVSLLADPVEGVLA
ncbi:hypothetical protein TeGR_g9062, partial [Tetraparma gracilis]